MFLKKAKAPVPEEVSDQDENEDLGFNDQGNMNNDREILPPEKLEENIIKTLTSNNPNAPHNLVQFSFKDRNFKVD